MSPLDMFLHLFAPLTANCRSFDERWQAAQQLDAQGISGCWEGEWISDASGHRGRLRCVINPVAPGLWRLYFRAEYARILRACYSTDFAVAQDDGRWTFRGGSDLGTLGGGAYTYEGSATLQELVCSYRSAKDHGQFRLRRY